MAFGTCFECGGDTDLLCQKCERYYCATHASIFNKRYCTACGPNTSMSLEVVNVAPTEGRAAAKHFKLIGEGWPSQIEKIRDLSDEELEDKIFYYRNLLKEVSRTRDTVMITLSAHENESIGRSAKRIRGSGKIASGLKFSPSTDSPRKNGELLSPEDKAIKKLADAMHIDIDKARRVFVALKKKV